MDFSKLPNVGERIAIPPGLVGNVLAKVDLGDGVKLTVKPDSGEELVVTMRDELDDESGEPTLRITFGEAPGESGEVVHG